MGHYAPPRKILDFNSLHEVPFPGFPSHSADWVLASSIFSSDEALQISRLFHQGQFPW